VIQEKAVKPIGDTTEIPVDVRILSASNKILLNENEEGLFRQELYYRINVIELCVPTLQERSSDIPLLTNAILKRLAKDSQREKINISSKAMAALKSYSFPGNVRELENILERAMTLCNNNIIDNEDLQLSEVNKSEQITDEEGMDLDQKLEKQEKELIVQALDNTKWNRTAAAKLLGVSFRTLRYRLKKHDLD
jgi:two-component system response regulator PilR (NtrC family)